MKKFYLLLVVVVCTDSVSSLTVGLKYRERKTLKDAHNRYRIIDATQGSRSASNMRKMNWNKKLAVIAQAHANKCTYDHSDSVRKGFGESLFTSTANLRKKGVATAVYVWYKERQYYDSATGKCLESKVCDHYKQVVWASASKVGCGLTFCPIMGGISGKNVYNVVCNYNKIVMKSKKPYVQGKPCSHCPVRYQRCSKETGNLCLYGRNRRTLTNILIEMMDRQ